MKSMKESVQETSESERQAVISAHELAADLRSEMPQETTACDPWKSKVIRLTEVVEQSTKRTAGRNSLHCSSVPPPPPGLDCSQRFAVTKSRFTITDIATSRRQPMGTYSIDFYCSVGHPMKVP